MKYYDIFKKKRKELGYSIKELSEKSKISEKIISEIETNKIITIPSLIALDKLCSILEFQEKEKLDFFSSISSIYKFSNLQNRINKSIIKIDPFASIKSIHEFNNLQNRISKNIIKTNPFASIKSLHEFNNLQNRINKSIIKTDPFASIKSIHEFNNLQNRINKSIIKTDPFASIKSLHEFNNLQNRISKNIIKTNPFTSIRSLAKLQNNLGLISATAAKQLSSDSFLFSLAKITNSGNNTNLFKNINIKYEYFSCNNTNQFSENYDSFPCNGNNSQSKLSFSKEENEAAEELIYICSEILPELLTSDFNILKEIGCLILFLNVLLKQSIKNRKEAKNIIKNTNKKEKETGKSVILDKRKSDKYILAKPFDENAYLKKPQKEEK